MNLKITSWIKGILLAVFVLSAGICYSCSRGEEESFLASEAAQAAETETAKTETEKTETADTERAKTVDPESEGLAAGEPKICYVHVCGQVLHPGVYRLEEGQRIYEAIELAGGFTAEASRTWLNLAEKVTDGMKLEVPDADQAQQWQQVSAAEENPPAGSGRVNINTATREELMTLKGIGEARAEDIIRFREKQGYFQTVEDIMKVPGIKDAAFEKIKDEITV